MAGLVKSILALQHAHCLCNSTSKHLIRTSISSGSICCQSPNIGRWTIITGGRRQLVRFWRRQRARPAARISPGGGKSVYPRGLAAAFPLRAFRDAALRALASRYARNEEQLAPDYYDIAYAAAYRRDRGKAPGTLCQDTGRGERKNWLCTPKTTLRTVWCSKNNCRTRWRGLHLFWQRRAVGGHGPAPHGRIAGLCRHPGRARRPHAAHRRLFAAGQVRPGKEASASTIPSLPSPCCLPSRWPSPAC